MFGLAPARTIDPVTQSLLRAMESDVERQFRLELAWHYYRGDMYSWLRDNKSAPAAKERGGKPTELASYFNPVKEIVDVDTAKVFAAPARGGNLDSQTDARLNAIWTRSNFEALLRKYVQGGASQGAVYLQVLDGPTSSIVARRLDELDVMKHPQTGEIIAAKQTVNVWDPLGIEGDSNNPGVPTGEGRAYRYDFLMTKTWYATYKDGNLWPFSSNPRLANGVPQARWANVLGFVPIIEVLHMDDGEGCGYSAWEAIKETIDAANTIATFMANTVKMHIDPLIVFYGMDRGDVEKTILNGQTNVFFVKAPPGVDQRHEVIQWQGNTGDIQGFIGWIKDRLVDVIPELQLSRIQEQAAPSGYSVMLQSMPLSDHIGALRTNYHKGLIDIDRMALLAEDVHNQDTDPVTAAGQLNDPNVYPHVIDVGPLLPVNRVEETDLASKMLADGVIDRLEYLTRSGYSLPDAKALIARVDKEKEDNANRMLGLVATGAEAASLRADNAANDPNATNSGFGA